MAVAYDAVSTVLGGTTGFSWTHTPVGTPAGVCVLIIQNGTVADQVTGATYGGVAMTEVTGSPLLEVNAATHVGGDGPSPGAIHGYFLGSGVPTGAQTVAVTVSGADNKRAVCVSVTADADTEVDDTATLDVASVPPGNVTGVTLETTRPTVALGANHAGVGNQFSVQTRPGFTQLFESDFGNQHGNWQRATDIAPAGDVDMSWEQNAGTSDGILAVAIAEVGPAGPSEGTAGFDVDLTLDATGSAQHRGTAALDVDLALTAHGHAPHQGTAAFAFDVGLAAAGERQSAGAVDLALDVGVAATGDAPADDSAQGTAGFDVALELAAAGAARHQGTADFPLHLALGARSALPVDLWPVEVTYQERAAVTVQESGAVTYQEAL